MPLELPTYPDWNALGVSPEPMPHYEYDAFRRLPYIPDSDFESDHKQWVQNLSSEQRAIYNDYHTKVLRWIRASNKELKAIHAQDYQNHGLEMGVDSEHDLQVARNMATLYRALDNVKNAVEGEEANQQFAQFFRRRSET